MTGYLSLAAAWGAFLASPLLVRFCLEGRVRPRTAVRVWFFTIVAAALATVLVLALAFLHFFAGSLLATMGERCAGIFASSHAFLAAGRINYLLAALLLTALLFQLLFVVGGGLRLLAASVRAGRAWQADAMSCPALAEISDRPWAGRIAIVPDTAATAGALTVGLFRPRILMPAGLVAALDGSELRAVAVHEEAHRAGRDNLIIAAARVLTLTFFFLPGLRFAFGRMRSAMEQAADRCAAREAGGALTVAGALMSVAAMVRDEKEFSYAAGIGGPGITGRIEALLSESPRRCWRRFTIFAVLSAVSLSLFTASALAVATDGHNDAIVCFTRHHLPAGGDTCDV